MKASALLRVSWSQGSQEVGGLVGEDHGEGSQDDGGLVGEDHDHGHHDDGEPEPLPLNPRACVTREQF